MTNLKLTNPKLYILKLKGLYKFFKTPDINASNNQSIKTNIKDTFVLFLLNLFISILLAILIVQLFDAEKTAMVDMEDKFSPIVILLLGGLLAPFLEEIVFRLSLKFKPIYLSLSTALLFFYFISKFYFNTGYINLENNFLLRFSISILLGVITYFVSTKYSNNLKKIWNNNFNWIYYFSIIFFGFAHITTYELNTENILLMPFLTLPQSVGGIITGYVRIKYGFIYACFFHSINNLFALSFAITF